MSTFTFRQAVMAPVDGVLKSSDRKLRPVHQAQPRIVALSAINAPGIIGLNPATGFHLSFP
jgi:hypothetical protein